MAIINCIECGNAFSDKAPACPHCGCPIEFANPQYVFKESTTQKVHPESNSRRTLLRDYLERIRLLESDMYTLTELIDKLNPLIKECPTKSKIIPPTKPSPPRPPRFYSEFSVTKYTVKAFGKGLTSVGFNPIGAVYWGVRDGVESAAKTVKGNKMARKWNIELQEKFDQDNKLYYEQLLPEYEKQMVQYEDRVREEDARYDREVARIRFYNQGITEQIELAIKEKESTEMALRRLYDTGIIFHKYRGIVPVTMFCEYMDSGRRTELEGVHGMYDLYEQELLGQQIVNSISEVNRSLRYISYQIGGIANQLSGIARNQIMLHEEIARGNEISRRISQDTSEMLSQSAAMLSSVEEIEMKLRAIHKTSEMSAYNTEVTARRVDAIAKIEEYEYSLRHPMFPSV